jgi:hypothetical protein
MMQRPRVRFTMRRMMVAVAVLAVVFGLYKRRETFLALADYHNKGEKCAGFSTFGRMHWVNQHGEGVTEAKSDWHVQLAEKYRGAASRPWLPVEPDPPEPE